MRTTILLTLPLWFLLVGAAQAGDWVVKDSKVVMTCESDEESREIKDCKILDASRFPCYQKMREAMRLAEGELINKTPHLPPKSFEEREERYRRGKLAIEQWDATVKECVQ